MSAMTWDELGPLIEEFEITLEAEAACEELGLCWKAWGRPHDGEGYRWVEAYGRTARDAASSAVRKFQKAFREAS